MKRADLFPPKQRGRKSAPASFTPLQAAANRALFEQELEHLDNKATVYFQDFAVGQTRRNWILPGNCETWRDLKDEQIDFVLKHLDWFKKQIAKCTNTEDDIPYD